MKKIISTLCMALTAVAMMAQNPVITFEKTEHDFGKINEADGRVSVVFSFKNEGMAPLVLSNVRASCGCTTPTWTKEPVEPGQSGSITVTYNPNGRPGRFQKTVTITSNASEPTKKVYIKGEVIPKQAKPVNKYTVAVGELSMKTTTLDLGIVKKGENKSGELEYANMTKENHEVKLATRPADSYIINQVTLPSVKANEVGKFVFALESANTKLYGPIEVYAYVEIDGKAVKVVSLKGMGLWGGISGYLAIDPEGKVYGAYFNHEGETAGLGAEIKDSQAWQEKFIGKQIWDENGNVVLSVVKKVEDPATQVDCVTGATLTSNGVDAMLKDGLKNVKPNAEEE